MGSWKKIGLNFPEKLKVGPLYFGKLDILLWSILAMVLIVQGPYYSGPLQ